MVIQHADDRWLPPTVNIPAEGYLGTKGALISKNLADTYGLQASLLRHLLEGENHHCVELEMKSDNAARQLKAVWVGSSEYERFRGSAPGAPDVFADWLAVADQRDIPRQRPAWERPGWLTKASAWIEHELDRRDIQVTGSVQQFRVCWHASAILRVRTSQGYYYFKASYAKPPNETAVMLAAAEKWPDVVPRPLAADIGKNWMLTRDYGPSQEHQLKGHHFPDIVRTMAELQIGSIDEIDEWKDLGCGPLGLDRIATYLNNRDGLLPILGRDPGKFADDELDRLQPVIDQLSARCDRLAGFGIPDTLVHPDFRPANLYRNGDRYWVVDWADSMISHPFFSLAWFVESLEKRLGRESEQLSADEVSNAVNSVVDAYLDVFSSLGSQAHLQEALVLARELTPAWNLCRWIELLPYLEADTRAFRRVDHTIRSIIRTYMKELPNG